MKLKVLIDKDHCLGYGDCAEAAPSAFEVDDVARQVGDAPADDLIAAARACPTDAIRLIDAETGEEIEL